MPINLKRVKIVLDAFNAGNAVKLGQSLYRQQDGKMQQRLEVYINSKPTGKMKWYDSRVTFDDLMNKIQAHEPKVLVKKG